MKTCFFDKPACQNLRESLRKEWVETNGLGDYASSTIPCCNTRKYHGLLVANLSKPSGRHVLLSSLDESLIGGRKDFFLSCRKHPFVYYPRGHKNMSKMLSAKWPVFYYRIGDLTIKREVLMIYKRRITLVRYLFQTEDTSPLPLKFLVKPLVAFRGFHKLTTKNDALNEYVNRIDNGFSVAPYDGMPSLFMQSAGANYKFMPENYWCEKVEYVMEQDRGFDYSEDLFVPGGFEFDVSQSIPFIVSASTEEIKEDLHELWANEIERRVKRKASVVAAMPNKSDIMCHLGEKGESFLIENAHGQREVLAGYHWFDAWGRDTGIALPGLTFYAGRTQDGIDTLLEMGQNAKDGIIPNMFNSDGVNHAYNSVDASLWYVFAVQQLQLSGKYETFIKDNFRQIIKNIISSFRAGKLDTVYVDTDGLLHAGDINTQLTWMDANVNGKPVTPRYGYPVDINALWYNAIAYENYLAKKSRTKPLYNDEELAHIRKVFKERFWLEDEEYLADVWREDFVDKSLRPNQLFAISLMFPVLEKEYFAKVVQKVKNTLLTPYGLRTLAPSDPNYCSVYAGNGEARDNAYHQGTVWPWLLGAYGDALLKSTQETEFAVKDLLNTVAPLFERHVCRAGLGNISEVFDGSPPHYPSGCVSQAWSVGEGLRLLYNMYKAAPQVYEAWEKESFEV